MKAIILIISLFFTCVVNSYGQERYGMAAPLYDSEEYTIKYCYLVEGNNYVLYDTDILIKYLYKVITLSEVDITIRNQKYHFVVDKDIEEKDCWLIYTTDKNVWMKFLENKAFLYLHKKIFLLTDDIISD